MVYILYFLVISVVHLCAHTHTPEAHTHGRLRRRQEQDRVVDPFQKNMPLRPLLLTTTTTTTMPRRY